MMNLNKILINLYLKICQLIITKMLEQKIMIKNNINQITFNNNNKLSKYNNQKLKKNQNK